MLPRRVGEIGDGRADDRFVRDVEVDVVVRAQAGGAPVDLDDLGVLALHLQPVARLERLADLQRDAGDDVAEQVLHREADDADDHGRSENHALDAVPVNPADDDEKGDDDDDQRGDLAEKFRGFFLLVPLVPQLPVVALHQRQDENRAEQHIGRTGEAHHGFAIRKVGAENLQRKPEREDDAEKVVEQSELDAGVALQPAPERDGADVEHRDGDHFGNQGTEVGQSGEHGRGV